MTRIPSINDNVHSSSMLIASNVGTFLGSWFMGNVEHWWMISTSVARTISGFDEMTVDDGSAARNVSSAFEPRKPKHSGRKSMEQRCSFDTDVAHPAHMATFTKLFHFDDVEQTCPTAIFSNFDVSIDVVCEPATVDIA